MTTTINSAAMHGAEIVAEYFRAPISTLEATARALGDELSAARRSGALAATRLDALVEPYAQAALALPDTSVFGAGFIAAADLLSDARNHLSWWQGAERRKLVLAAQSVNKELIDYSALEWFRVPMVTGESHVAGPYVDYLCSDEYTITAASPVYIDGDFVGVAGLDVLIDSVELELMPRLGALGGRVTLVNGVGRVVISTDARRATGDFVSSDTLADLERARCAGVALDVIAE